MQPTGVRSAGVTASAALAIMTSATVLWFWGFFFQTMLQPQVRQILWQHYRLTFVLLAAGPPALVAASIRTGIGLFQLRPWARKAAMVWASLAATFCLLIIAFRPFETFVIPDRFVTDFESFKQLLVLSALILFFPLSVWWIFYFRLPGVKKQFGLTVAENPPSV